MLRKSLKGISLLSLLLVIECSNISPTLPVLEPEPGIFSLVQLDGLAKVSDNGINTINLGDLHSTTSYYFMLKNIGGYCITNISLSVSDSSFEVFPASMDSLLPGDQSIMPIIKLTAIHGVGVQGIGSAAIMSPGLHEVELRIQGKTKWHNNVDTTAKLLALSRVNALVMDVRIHSRLELYFSNPSGRVDSWHMDNYNLASVNLYSTGLNDSMLAVVNTGNVDITVETDIAGVKAIAANDSANFIIKQNVFTGFRIRSNNTVCDPLKMQMREDGNVYFIMTQKFP
jgi:hypothetical protein